MSQNSGRLSWAEDQLNKHLVEIMDGTHGRCVQYGQTDSGKYVNYVPGVNIAGSVKAADAMLAYGVV